jgi:alkylation response protein AidB-like acyl-CoA dehydrogenase
MDFRFTREQEAFRAKVRRFITQVLPRDWEGIYPDSYFTDEYWPFIRSLTKRMSAQGWLTMAWPKEYGGQALPVMQQVVYNEETAYARVPTRDSAIGVGNVGPVLMIHGSAEQRRRFLPPIARSDHVYFQGFSEPEAGSDLASLQLKATRDGDDYVLNGSKIWSSGAHRSTHGFVLARTDPQAPKHRGISAFIIPLDRPGIEVRPILNALNVHYFNQVFFDNARVPAENMVGPENRGWYVAATTLDFERSGVASFAASRRELEDLVDLAKALPREAECEPSLRCRLADLIVETEVGRTLSYRVAWMQSQGKVPNYESSMTKLFGSELSQRVAQAGIALLGLYGPLDRGSKRAVRGGRPAWHYVDSVAATIRGGTSEVQRGIMATRGLGLPRG